MFYVKMLEKKGVSVEHHAQGHTGSKGQGHKALMSAESAWS